MKIICGGQTGVDRGALDAALAAGVTCGGWCPKGRLVADGRIPDRYPLLTIAGGYSERTARNIAESDGTLIISLATSVAEPVRRRTSAENRENRIY